MNKALKLKILLLKHGLKQNRLAQEVGVSPHMVSYVVRGLRHSRRVQAHIARRLNRSEAELFDPPARKRGRPAQIKEAS